MCVSVTEGHSGDGCVLTSTRWLETIDVCIVSYTCGVQKTHTKGV